MIQANIKELEKDLKHYISQVVSGEIIVIFRDNKPIAEMIPLPYMSSQQRPYGLCSEEIQVADNFDDALPDDIVKGFEGNENSS